MCVLNISTKDYPLVIFFTKTVHFSDVRTLPVLVTICLHNHVLKGKWRLTLSIVSVNNVFKFSRSFHFLLFFLVLRIYNTQNYSLDTQKFILNKYRLYFIKKVVRKYFDAKYWYWNFMRIFCFPPFKSNFNNLNNDIT